MKKLSSQLARWFDQRTLRERGVLLVCCVMLLVILVYSFILNPAAGRHATIRRQINTMTTEIQTLKATATIISSREQQDPDRELRMRHDQLEPQLARQRQRLHAGMSQLVTPQEMPALLKQLLTRQQKLELLTLENLPPEVVTIGAEVAGSTAPRLYRHRLQMELRGDYLSAVAYLRQLETLPRALVWEDIEITGGDYPAATIRLKVYTLGLTEGWIGG